MSDSSGASSSGSTGSLYVSKTAEEKDIGGDSADECSQAQVAGVLTRHVMRLRPGLKRFYKEPAKEFVEESEPVKLATNFVNFVKKNYEISKEEVLPLAVLVLYKIVMLVDNSLTMAVEQGGEREKTLKTTLERVFRVYIRSRTPTDEQLDIKILNGTYDHDVRKRTLKSYLEKMPFHGLTPLGTVLQKKIINKYVQDGKAMTKPLLIMIITDGEVEGEPKDRLKSVITATAAKLLREEADVGAQAVSYQFAKIGNDKKATEMVQALDDDKALSPYVDCLLQSKLEYLQSSDKKERWDAISKLFLGAIDPEMDSKASHAAKEDDEFVDSNEEVKPVEADTTLDETEFNEDEEV